MPTSQPAASSARTGPSVASSEGLSRPVWFGDSAHPLFGWLHEPSETSNRGGVVLCGPLAKQYDTTYYTLRLLAEGLARAGFSTLRFDYRGTGDSDGLVTDPFTVAAWHAGVASAAELLDSLGCRSVAMVGLQVGALLAAQGAASRSAAGAPVSGLVLWDPPASGAAFLREQRAFGALAMGARPGADSSFESPAQLWTGEMVRDLRQLIMPTAGLPAATLVLSREGANLAALTRDVAAATALECETFTGHEDFYEHAKVPHAAVDRIVDWFDSRPSPSPLLPLLPARTETFADTAVVHAEDGTPVTERAVRLGPNDLFGVLSSGADATGPTIVLVGGYVYPHTGPGRTWVQLARQLAATGHRVLRLDLSGIGDSGLRPGQLPQQYFAAEGAEDIAHAVSAISPTDPRDVILVGFCSGAYAVIEAAAMLRPRAVVSVNYVPEFTPPELVAGGPVDERRNAFVARPRWIVRLRERGLLRRLREVVPEWGWQLLNRLGIVPSPTTGFKVLLAAGVATRALSGPEDAELFLARAGRQLARMAKTAPFSFTVLDGVGHSVLSVIERQAVVTAVMREVADLLGDGGPATPTVDIPARRVGGSAEPVEAFGDLPSGSNTAT
ncbi:MAG: hypothetical protein QOG52_1141 [Frankiaceae bacterium]|jgi:alpha-beta hydrolase superfamily lysophospholipase|nr:hypothetical protein [Frankiaceae bacterium]